MQTGGSIRSSLITNCSDSGRMSKDPDGMSDAHEMRIAMMNFPTDLGHVFQILGSVQKASGYAG